jgi:methyl-accepting chemotaxis protein
MNFSVENITLWVIGLGVVVLIGVLVVAWIYLKGIFKGLDSLNQDTKVFSDSAKSLSLDIKSLTLSLSAMGQDIRNMNQYSATMSQDMKTFNQNADNLAINIEKLSGSIYTLTESQNKMMEAFGKVEQKQDETGKSIERISKHFSE